MKELQQRFEQQTNELDVHRAELEAQNEALREINQELERARNSYADLFEFAPLGYVICDQQGIIQQLNQAACALLGAASSQLIRRHFSLFLEDHQRATFNTLLRATLDSASAHGTQQRQVLSMLRPDGRCWDAQLQSTGVVGAQASVVRLSLTDITDLKHAQREAERRTTQAQQLRQELEMFLHSMTHELTRPLRQVEGFAALLGQTLLPSDQKSAAHLQHLLTAASEMGALTTSLTRFFQVAYLDHRPQAVDLNRLMAVITNELKPQLLGRDLAITHDALPVVLGDRESLHEVFSNLLSNAVKFTRPCPQASIHVGCEEHEETYVFSVRDNGVGFDMRQSGRLFGVFERLHSERAFEGLGLGLALVRRIVQRFHGRVWAESGPGQRTVFWVQLPKIPAGVADAGCRAKPEPAAEGRHDP